MTALGRVVTLWLLLLVIVLSSFAQPAPAILWTRIYDAPYTEVPWSIAETPDGGFAMCGYIFDSTSTIDALIRKVSSTGDEEWIYRFDRLLQSAAQDIILTSDGNLLVVGRYDTLEVMGVFVLKLSLAGDSLWTRFFLDTEMNTGVAVVETEDGGYAIAGKEAYDVPPHSDGRLLRLDHEGDLLWTSYVSQGSNIRTDIDDIVQTPDGGYLLYGSTFRLFSSENHRLLLAKLNVAGDTVWTRHWENPDWDLLARNLVAMPEGGYLLSAVVYNETHPWLLRLDEDGDTLWTRRLAEGYPSNLPYVVVDNAGNGDIILSGEAWSGNIARSYVARLDANGYSRWDTTVSHDPDWFSPARIITCQTGGYALLVNFYNPDSSSRSALLRFGLDTLNANEQTPVAVVDFQLQQNFPNPFNQRTHFKVIALRKDYYAIDLFDASARQVRHIWEGDLVAGEHLFSFDGQGLSSGSLFCSAKTRSSGQYSIRMILLK